jgi:integrase
LKLAQAWASYCASPSSRFYRRSKARKLIDPPDANGGEKLRGAEQTHRNYFAEFIDFCQRKFPEISTLADVSERAAVEWFAWLTENKTADGANNRLLFLRGVYRALIADRRIIIARNPFSEIRKIPADHYRKRPLSREQIAALIDAAPRADFAMLIRIGYFTGLRLGDCATLRWAEIDQQRQIIERVPCKTARHLRGGEKITAKIAVNPQLAAHLARLARSGEFVLPKLAQEYLTHTSNFKSRLRKIFTRAGIVNAECRESGRKICHYGFHSLRYSFISHCAEAGVPQIVLLDNAGHTSAAISQHYQRLSDAAALQYRAVLSLPEAERSAN